MPQDLIIKHDVCRETCRIFETTFLAKDQWQGFSTRNPHMVHIVNSIKNGVYVHLSISLFLYFNNLVSVTAGRLVSHRGHM